MALRVDLNADMGEGIGNDAALLSIVTSANVACGFHAGSLITMRDTMAEALRSGVGLGAHPGFDDKANFGRTRMRLSAEELGALTAYQLGAAIGVAKSLGGRVRHLKLHGALANMASEEPEIARACYEAALKVQPDIVLMVIAATAQEAVARELGVDWAGEIFADRAYNDDATLVDRAKEGAVLHDPALITERILRMLEEEAIIAQSGKRIPCKIDTICLHGDTKEAVEIAASLRVGLTTQGISLARL